MNKYCQNCNKVGTVEGKHCSKFQYEPLMVCYLHSEAEEHFNRMQQSEKDYLIKYLLSNALLEKRVAAETSQRKN